MKQTSVLLRPKTSWSNRGQKSTQVDGGEHCAMNMSCCWNLSVTYNGTGQRVKRPSTSSKCTHGCKIVVLSLPRNFSALRIRAPSARSRKVCNSRPCAAKLKITSSPFSLFSRKVTRLRHEFVVHGADVILNET